MKETHLGVPQQLHHSSLIGGEPRNLPNHGPHKLGLGRLDTLALTGADDFFNGSCWVALVKTITQVCESQEGVR